ncbi:DNA polymerase II subunit 2, partial [Haematococcus lacustris]
MNLVLVEESSGAHDQDRVVVAADVWLDKRETLAALGTLLAGFQEVAIVPPVIVLMGNFHSKSAAGAADFQELKDGFAALARLIDQFPRIKASTRFVFVPGPGDPGPAAVLPQPPLTPYFTADIMACMPNAVFASNPC